MNDFKPTFALWLIAGVALIALGCDSSTNSGGGADMDELAAMLDQPEPSTPQEDKKVEVKIEPPEEPTVVTARDPRRAKAFSGQAGYFNAVFTARFVAENKLIFAQVKKTMDLYKATHGYNPKSHDEFWKEIIGKGMIKLPELEDGYEYWYNAETGELMKRTVVEE